MTQQNEPHADKAATRVAAAAPMRQMMQHRRGNGADSEPEAEKELWVGHTNWKHFADLILVALGWSVIAVIVGLTMPRVMGWIVGTMAALGWLYVAGRILHAILNYRYRLTTQRLFIERGILSRTIDQAELIRVHDVRIHKTLLNRFTGLGSIEIFSTDTSDRQVTIRGVAQPEQIADSIRQRMRELRQKSLFVESL